MADDPRLQKLTAKDLAEWVPAAQAIKQAESAYGEFDLAARTLFGRLCIGALRSGADMSGIDGAGTLTAVVEIHPQHWATISLPTTEDVLWKTGELLIRLPARRDVMGNITKPGAFMRYLGVRFERVGFDKLLAEAPEPPAASPATSKEVVSKVPVSASSAIEDVPRGRRPYDWDSIWALIGARLAAGWRPSQQKDIEAEMRLQAGNLGWNPIPGRTVIQERASKLVKALKLKE